MLTSVSISAGFLPVNVKICLQAYSEKVGHFSYNDPQFLEGRQPTVGFRVVRTITK